MQTHPAKRVEITIEAPMERRLRKVLKDADITGYTIVPVRGGSGRSGEWTREGQVGRSGMVQFQIIIRPDRLGGLLDAAFAVVEKQIGVVCITDAQVLRAERF
ncbi:MAG: transcriptional regulator [Pseudomonadota bacterium]